MIQFDDIQLNSKPDDCDYNLIDNNNNDGKNNFHKSRTTFPFGLCKVCNDKATGFHYGVESCEGCKGFFKRTTVKNEKYRCYFGNNCDLKPDNRSRCKACRYRRCVEAGMSLGNVKMGRIPKDVRQKVLENRNVNESDCQIITSYESNHCFMDVNSYNFNKRKSFDDYDDDDNNETRGGDDDDDVILIEQNNDKSLVNPMMYNNYTLEVLSDFLLSSFKNDINQVNQQMNQAYFMIKQNITQIECIDKSLIWSGLADSIKHHVKYFIDFARSIPLFNELDIKEFSKIIEEKLFEFCVIRDSKLFINNEFYLVFSNGVQYTRENATKLAGPELVNRMLQLKYEINNLNLNDRELSVLIVYVITDPKLLNLKNNNFTKFHELICRVLANEFHTSKRSLTFLNNLQHILKKLSELRIFEQQSFRTKNQLSNFNKPSRNFHK